MNFIKTKFAKCLKYSILAMKPFFYQMFTLPHCTTINATATATTLNQRVSDTTQIYCDARQK